MRVIAGRFRGQRLVAPAGDRTRPTADRVRESLFSILGDLDGARVLDLFAGTGALGIEALSRGAARVTFVERDRAALAALRRNLDAVGPDADAVRVVTGDALRHLQDAAARDEAYDLVLLDPPYRDADRLGPLLDQRLAPVLAPGAAVVSESDRRHPLTLVLPLTDERRYGDTTIRIHTP
jgi:16S rRNA (guanine966-N2)-methyltransferase